MTKDRILVVDDDAFCRELLAELLELKYEMLFAKDGYEALSILSYQLDKVEAVLLDLMMPIMDGFGFITEFNSRGWNEKLPIIVVSSNDDEESLVRCNEMGIKYFVSKPYDSDEASRIIGEAISDFRQAGLK